MGWFDWGRQNNANARPGVAASPVAGGPSEDERALERYRYMLRTAPPETIEQAHAEAFAQLTPEQRRLLLQDLAQNAPASERPVLERAGDSPQGLARAATRAEMRQPGMLERVFGNAGRTPMGAGMAPVGGMPGFGSMMAGSLLGSIAGTVLGSAIAHQFLSQPAHAQALGNLGLGPDSASHADDASHAESDASQSDATQDVDSDSTFDDGTSDYASADDGIFADGDLGDAGGFGDGGSFDV